MTKTPAQRNAAYRTRKAERIARMEAALQSIANNLTAVEARKRLGECDFETAYDAFIRIASEALAKPTNT